MKGSRACPSRPHEEDGMETEPKTTLNTGNVRNEWTVEREQRI